MSWLKKFCWSKGRQIFKNVKREPRSFGEFNCQTVSPYLREEWHGGTHNWGSGQDPTPLGCQCADRNSCLRPRVTDLVPFVDDDPLPRDVQQGRFGLLSFTRTLYDNLRTPAVVADDRLVGGQYDIVLS